MAGPRNVRFQDDAVVHDGSAGRDDPLPLRGGAHFVVLRQAFVAVMPHHDGAAVANVGDMKRLPLQDRDLRGQRTRAYRETPSMQISSSSWTQPSLSTARAAHCVPNQARARALITVPEPLRRR